MRRAISFCLRGADGTSLYYWCLRHGVLILPPIRAPAEPQRLARWLISSDRVRLRRLRVIGGDDDESIAWWINGQFEPAPMAAVDLRRTWVEVVDNRGLAIGAFPHRHNLSADDLSTETQCLFTIAHLSAPCINMQYMV